MKPTERRIRPRLLGVRHCAAYLGTSVYAVRGLILRGELPCLRIGEKTSPYKVDLRDLDEFIERKKQRLDL